MEEATKNNVVKGTLAEVRDMLWHYDVNQGDGCFRVRARDQVELPDDITWVIPEMFTIDCVGFPTNPMLMYEPLTHDQSMPVLENMLGLDLNALNCGVYFGTYQETDDGKEFVITGPRQATHIYVQTSWDLRVNTFTRAKYSPKATAKHSLVPLYEHYYTHWSGAYGRSYYVFELETGAHTGVFMLEAIQVVDGVDELARERYRTYLEMRDEVRKRYLGLEERARKIGLKLRFDQDDGWGDQWLEVRNNTGNSIQTRFYHYNEAEFEAFRKRVERAESMMAAGE